MRPIDTALSAQPIYSSATKAFANNAENPDTDFRDVMGAAADPTQVGSHGSGYVTTTAVTSSAAGTPGTGTLGGPGATAAQLAILQAGPGGSGYGTYIETLDEVNAEQEPGYNQAEFNSYWSASTSGQLTSQGGTVQTPAFIAYEGSNPEVVNADLEASGLAPAFTNLTDTTTTTSSTSGSSANTTDTAAQQTASAQQSTPTQPSAPTQGLDPTQVGSQGSGYVTTAGVTSSASSTPGSGEFGGPGATAAQMAILQAGPGGSGYNTYIETQNEVKAEQEPGFNQGEFNTYWSALTGGQLASEGGSVKTPAFIAYEGSNPQVVNAELEAAGLPPAFTNLTDTTASNGSVIST
jgi:hypothetical protein